MSTYNCDYFCKEYQINVQLERNGGFQFCTIPHCNQYQCPLNPNNLIVNILFDNQKKRIQKQSYIGWSVFASIILIMVIAIVFWFNNKPGQQTNERLIAQIKSNDPEIALNAAIELAKRKNSEGLDTLFSALESGEYWDRINAISALVQLGDDRAIPELSNALQDTDINVVKAASEALSQFGAEKTSEQLLLALIEKQNSERWAVAIAFTKLKDERAIPYLIEAEGNVNLRTIDQDIITKALMNQGDNAVTLLVESVLNGGPGIATLAEIEIHTGRKITQMHDAIKDRDLELLSHIYGFFLLIDQDDDYDGIDERLTDADQEVLAEALFTYGDLRMAQSFINFRSSVISSSILSEAAATWAEQNGYTITVR